MRPIALLFLALGLSSLPASFGAQDGDGSKPAEAPAAQRKARAPQGGQRGAAKGRAPKGKQGQPNRKSGEGAKAKGGERSSARQRWEAMTEAERTEMRQRFERLKSMPESERKSLEKRAKSLDELARRVYQGMDASARKRLDSLSPEKRRTILLEIVATEASEAGERLLATLPAELRTRVEQATPADRERFLQDFRRKHASRVDRGLEKLGAELGVQEAERSRWSALPEDARRLKFMELVKRKVLAGIQAKGLPKGLDESTWQRAVAMGPEDFLVAFRKLRALYPELEGIHGGSRGGPDGWGGRRGGARSRDAEAGAGREGERPGQRAGGEGLSPGMHKLRRALWPSPELRLEFAELPKSERKAKLNQRLRRLAQRVLKEEQLVDAETLTELSALESDGEFLDRVHDLAFQGRGRNRAGRGENGPRRERGEAGERKERPGRGERGQGARSPEGRRGAGDSQRKQN